jgi:hypothetical protein
MKLLPTQMEKWDMGLKAQSQKAAAKRGKEWRSYW